MRSYNTNYSKDCTNFKAFKPTQRVKKEKRILRFPSSRSRKTLSLMTSERTDLLMKLFSTPPWGRVKHTRYRGLRDTISQLLQNQLKILRRTRFRSRYLSPCWFYFPAAKELIACPRGRDGPGAAPPAPPPGGGGRRPPHRRCLCHQRRTVCLRTPHVTCRAASNVLVKTISFMKNLPSFHLLPREDQLLLLDSCWVPLFLLGLVQEMVTFEVMETPAPSMLKKILLDGQSKHREPERTQPTLAAVQRLQPEERAPAVKHHIASIARTLTRKLAYPAAQLPLHATSGSCGTTTVCALRVSHLVLFQTLAD
ncbi:PREDICTED: uncharacterized protein LOC103913797 [Pygoscelis adeliae]|uniref:uncharacterized protein LOC103913797 n=1 Tax=Pygoscelis adeliae TaxID=9238 RepID=UPI0004F4E541|nr:PREDICTED: uncharacterized protein LOC103913797 [Pygoscelis adeliae]